MAEGLGPAWYASCDVKHRQGSRNFRSAARCAMTQCVAACEAGHTFSCLSPVGVMPAPVGETLTQELTLVDFVSTDQPLPGVNVRACTRVGWADPTCSHSLDAEGVSDEHGGVTLEMPYPLLSVKRPWDGYLLATGRGLKPDLRIFSTPRTNDFAYRYELLTQEVYELVAASLGVVETASQGGIGVTVYDCNLAPAAGVEVDLVPRPPGVRRAYSRALFQFDESLTETDVDGTVIFSNVPAGKPLTLRATVTTSGAVLNELDVLVLPGVRTGVVLEPRVREQ